MMANAGDDDSALPAQGRVQDQRRLIVQELMIPTAGDEFGDDEDLSYHFLLNGKTLHIQLDILKKIINENIDVYIVTGRANSQESIQKLFQEIDGRLVI